MTYILRATDGQGKRFYYTGRAGDGWVSESQAEAFDYLTREGARRKATGFNKMSPIHGLWFVSVPVFPIRRAA